jgi:hypothetical protein
MRAVYIRFTIYIYTAMLALHAVAASPLSMTKQ